MRKILDVEIGDTFGDLTCIDIVPPSNGNSTKYLMKCNICGREKLMLSSTIRLSKGITHKACGKGIKHKDLVFAQRYAAMRTRTTNPNYQHYDDYGGRGINSDAFENFIDFYDAMYDSYKELADEIGANNVSLERIDCDGNYTPDNCEWIDKKHQQQNTRRSIIFDVEFPDGHIERRKCFNKFCNEVGLNIGGASEALNCNRSYHGYKFTRIEE